MITIFSHTVNNYLIMLRKQHGAGICFPFFVLITPKVVKLMSRKGENKHLLFTDSEKDQFWPCMWLFIRILSIITIHKWHKIYRFLIIPSWTMLIPLPPMRKSAWKAPPLFLWPKGGMGGNRSKLQEAPCSWRPEIVFSLPTGLTKVYLGGNCSPHLGNDVPSRLPEGLVPASSLGKS